MQINYTDKSNDVNEANKGNKGSAVKKPEVLEKLLSRNDVRDIETENQVREIIENVRSNGDPALKMYTEKFDGACPADFEIDRNEMERSFERVDEGFRDAIIRAASNIKRYHSEQKLKGYEISDDEGIVIGQTVRGLDRVGLYVPGGTAAYPSTVLMNAIPAKIAGVGELIMTSPHLDDNILAAAFVAGIDRVFNAGGAQMIAALAYGTDTVPKVDKIVGPGNIYVATAKKILFGQVSVEMIAGPSEVLILADETADPKFIAADMLSQAEHDELAAAVLLTVDEEIAEEVITEIKKQTDVLARKDIIEKSLENHGVVLVCRSIDEMIRICNEIAPEHVEVMMNDPLAYVSEIRNAGSIFAGSYAPEPLGDYFSGTNHVLPTSGTARFASPLGVYDFVKRTSYTCYSEEALRKAKDDIMTIGKAEGLSAHVNSVKIRFED